MFSGFKFFEKEYEKYLRIDFALDARLAPTKLMNDLRNSGVKK
jgi:hypothetical protein